MLPTLYFQFEKNKTGLGQPSGKRKFEHVCTYVAQEQPRPGSPKNCKKILWLGDWLWGSIMQGRIKTGQRACII